MISAGVDEEIFCLGQLATDQKSNEITAVPMLLELLQVQGGVVTLDALNCQQKMVQQIVDQEADYVITVKANQPKLFEAILDQFIEFDDNDGVTFFISSLPLRTARRISVEIEL